MKYLYISVSVILAILAFVFYNLNKRDFTGELGPQIGTQIPHTLNAPDHTGKARSFDNLTGENGLVISFVRSADWCPFCKWQLRNLQEHGLNAFASKGYGLVSISYDTVEKLDHFAHNKGITYPLLSDEASKIIKAFGILNEKHKPGASAYGIPHPIIIITDAKGTITAKLYENTFMKRPQVEAILSTIDELGQQ